MNITLIGFMAAGKSTLANNFAQDTGYRLISVDQEIEKERGMTISQIFDELGEDQFRKIEREILIKILQDDNQIIDCGGGVAQYNADLIKNLSYVIYVYADFDIIWKRLEGDNSRPLAKKLSKEELINLYLVRDKIYRKLANEIIINN